MEDRMVNLKMSVLNVYTDYINNRPFAQNYNIGYINALWENDLVTQDEYNRLLKFNVAIFEGLETI